MIDKLIPGGGLVTGIVTDVLKKVVGRAIDSIPMPQSEKDRLRVEADAALAEHAGTIAEAEARMVEATRDMVLADATAESWLQRNWRPMGMYFMFYMWGQNILVSPIVNAVVPGLLPTIPWEHIIWYSTMFSGLYMGGHMVQRVADTAASAYAARKGAG